MSWASVTSNIGTISGVLFIIQIAAQIKYFGFKCWIREGMGVGVTRKEADSEATK